MLLSIDRSLRVRAEIMVALALVGVFVSQVSAQPDKGKEEPPKSKDALKVGLVINDPKAFQGYTLLSPLLTKKTYLIDVTGSVLVKYLASTVGGTRLVHRLMYMKHVLRSRYDAFAGR